MTDLIVGSAMALFFLALLVFAVVTGTMPSMVPTIDSTTKEDSPGWFWALGLLNLAGMLAGVTVFLRGLGVLSS